MSNATSVALGMLDVLRDAERFERKLAELHTHEREKHAYAADVLYAVREGLEAGLGNDGTEAISGHD